MVGATNQRTATAAVAGAGGITVAAGVCAVVVGRYRHLRCAPGVCLILECKITKVVERPGVHYRGRHSPLISGYLAGSFCSTTALHGDRTTHAILRLLPGVHAGCQLSLFSKTNL